MKLFKSLLIAPAALGLLAPMSANANEIDFQSISNYSDAEYQELDSDSFNYPSVNNTLLSGGEGLVDSSDSFSDSFSSTTTASFSAEAILGGISTELPVVDGAEAVSFDYQYQIGLTSSFTGEDSLSVTIDAGGPTGEVDANDVSLDSASAALFDMNATDDALVVDGISYTFPVGGSTMMVGDSTDISTMYTGACAYGGFMDYITDCGTGNSVGLGGAGATVAGSYAFDGGFSLAGGISSPNTEILGTNATPDIYGLEAAYTADDFGVSVAFSDQEVATYLGVNGFYTFDFATFSAGYEAEDNEDAEDASAFFIGLTKEIGPGTAELGYASSDMLVFDGQVAEETASLYEVSYAYPVNDALTITPGIAIVEVDAGESTVAAIKASFSF